MISGVCELSPSVFTDYRGDLWTTWKKDEFDFDIDFNHDKVSTSRKNVLRGIHGDFKSWKPNGVNPPDSVLKQLSEVEREELFDIIQSTQFMGEEDPSSLD